MVVVLGVVAVLVVASEEDLEVPGSEEGLLHHPHSSIGEEDLTTMEGQAITVLDTEEEVVLSLLP